jgi:DNA-binding transcriptional LysR family regulator
MNVTLRQFRAFYEVAQAKSFTVAARRMHLTQSAVSMLVRQLETEFGMLLFNRIQRTVQLTEAGQQMLPITERILDDLRRVHDGAADLKALRGGTLRLAVPQILACTWLPPIITAYRTRYPDVALHVTDTTGDQIVANVQQNEAEIGIGPKRPTPIGISAEMLWEEPIQLVCPASRQIKSRSKPKWTDFLNENWILYSEDFSLHLERTVWAKVRYSLPRTTNVRYLSTALAFVGKGLGVTAAPQYANRFAEQFAVTFLEMPDRRSNRAYYLYMRKNHELSPAASAFQAVAAEFYT